MRERERETKTERDRETDTIKVIKRVNSENNQDIRIKLMHYTNINQFGIKITIGNIWNLITNPTFSQFDFDDEVVFHAIYRCKK